MIPKLRRWWRETRSSFWFVPAVIVLGAVGLATSLIAIDVTIELHVDKRWPLVFGGGAAGSRGLLSAVASSMITVAGVVFSITIVALSLTSSQYTSRILRNFMRDRMNQVVLGVFVGIFAYCLVVLRTIRGGDEGAFVPSLAVMGGLILAFIGIGYLIFFIHHISISIQASNIIAAAAEETIAAINHLFPKELGENFDEDVDGIPAAGLGEQTWSAVEAQRTGYIESIEEDSLLALARTHGTIFRMERGIGEFVAKGIPLVSVAGSDLLDEDLATELNGIYVIGGHRTVQQDASAAWRPDGRARRHRSGHTVKPSAAGHVDQFQERACCGSTVRKGMGDSHTGKSRSHLQLLFPRYQRDSSTSDPDSQNEKRHQPE